MRCNAFWRKDKEQTISPWSEKEPEAEDSSVLSLLQTGKVGSTDSRRSFLVLHCVLLCRGHVNIHELHLKPQESDNSSWPCIFKRELTISELHLKEQCGLQVVAFLKPLSRESGVRDRECREGGEGKIMKTLVLRAWSLCRGIRTH